MSRSTVIPTRQRRPRRQDRLPISCAGDLHLVIGPASAGATLSRSRAHGSTLLRSNRRSRTASRANRRRAERSIQAPILNRLTYGCRSDFHRPHQIRDCPRDLEHPAIGARRQESRSPGRDDGEPSSASSGSRSASMKGRGSRPSSQSKASNHKRSGTESLDGSKSMPHRRRRRPAVGP